MTDREHLERLLQGNSRGLTRAQLVDRLRMTDRAVRKLIEDTVAESAWPIIADRTGGGEARYRIARADEWDAINRANAEDAERAKSLFRKAHGRRHAFLARYPNGALFLDPVPDLEDAAA